MAVPKALPEQWNGGARSAVEPYLDLFFGIELSETWRYLVKRQDLRGLPAANYNPLPDAELHIGQHAADPCKGCFVWRMLHKLWMTTARLYEGRMRFALWWETDRLLRRLRARVAALERDGPSDGWLTQVDEATRSLEALSSATLDPLDEDTRAVVVTGRRDLMLRRVCSLLRSGGFSYAQIARLIGDRTPNAAQRVRQRCKQAQPR